MECEENEANQERRARRIRELRRGEGVCCWARSVHGLRKEKEPEKKLRKKERKEGRKRRRSLNLNCCKVRRIKDLIPHTIKGMDLTYLVIFRSWGHGNGIG